jgi:adenine-specific DNA methylase
VSERPARPRVLIEDWLPIRELGIESRRESAPIPGQFPKLKTLHVWWARRPLAAAAGTILGSLLPAWSEELRQVFDDPRTATETAYRTWVLRLCGVWGDPVAARKVLAQANEAGRRLSGNGYGYSQAYKNSPTSRDLLLLHRILSWTWGGLPRVTDPTAGGGSIPYEAIRYGLPVNANDLNPVAASVLRAGVEVPARGGAGLKPELEKWGEELVQRCRTRLGQFFQLEDGRERVVAYIFARTVICPRNNKPTPLSPNWWLSKEKGDEWAVRVRTERDGAKLALPEFEILRAKEAIASDPDKATVSGGNGISVWDGLPIDGEYIKREAQAGRLGTLLYAVAVRYPAAPGGRTRFVRAFRPPTALDLQGLASAEAEVRRLLPTWLATGVVPSEEIPAGNDKRPQQYGMTRWIDLFSPRQLLVHATFVEEHHRIATELAEALGEGGGSTVAAMLGLMQGKAVNWDSILSSWDGSRSKIRSVFERHDLAFKWTFAEFEGAWELFPWCLEQLLDAYDELVALSRPGLRPYPVGPGTWSDPGDPAALEHPVPGPVTVTRGSAARLGVPSSSQTLVCIDPPYYDNVMYGELSDFFGVWEQHTVGAAWPDLMPGGLADTANEAVANVARFESFGRRKKELAHADYQAKMGAIFAECRRILRPDGVLTVMFTHKRAEAWDTLGTALMEAGFEIAASWPVNTESEQSLHLAKKNGASSTVMLVCRRRGEEPARETVFFEDLTGEIRAAAREAAARFAADGIAGVDLLLATYGPVLSVLSAAWPVYSAEADATGNARLLRPEEALDVAREELVQARRRALVGREVTFDAPTDFWLLAWELFQAEEFPYDEARRLALAIGGQDPEGLARAGLLTKRAGTVVLRPPADRRRQVLGPVRDGHLEGLALVDVLHAVLATAELDGLAAAKALMDRLALTGDARFVALVQGAVNALPRARKADKLIRQEAALLDALVTAYLPTVRLPGEEAAATLFDPD